MRFIYIALAGWLAIAWSAAQTPRQRSLAIISRLEPQSVITIRRQGVPAEEAASLGTVIYEGDVLLLRAGRANLVRSDGREKALAGAGTWPQPGDLDGLGPEPIAPLLTRMARWYHNFAILEKQAGGRNTGARYDPTTLPVIGVERQAVAPGKFRLTVYWIDSLQPPSTPRLLLLNSDRDIVERVRLSEGQGVLTNGLWRLRRSTAEGIATRAPALMRIADSAQGKSSPAIPWPEAQDEQPEPSPDQAVDHWSAGVREAARGHAAAALDHFLHDFKSTPLDSQSWNALALVAQDWGEASGQTAQVQFVADAFFRRAQGDKE